nr:zinc ribbon domain-containing protein [Desulforadius tongensis]
MPTYEFKCKECGKKFTVMVSVTEKDQVKCPECGSAKIQQLITGFFTKGSCGDHAGHGGG